MIQVTPVILCGGSGTRLCPLSCTGFALLLFVFVRQALRNGSQDEETTKKLAFPKPQDCYNEHPSLD